MDTLTVAKPSSDELQSAPGQDQADKVGNPLNFLIVDLSEEDEGSYECCRVC